MTPAVSPLHRIANRDWLLALLGALAAAALCIYLGIWQMHRYEAKSDRADVVAANYDAAPVPLDAVLPAHDSTVTADRDYTVVEESGSYCTDPDCVLYVRNRSFNGSVGYWQLVPFRTGSGTVLVVRGWVPERDKGSVPEDPPPVPDGTVSVRMHMRPTEDELTSRSDPPGQLQSVNAAKVLDQVPELKDLYTHGYGILAAESPATSPMPRLLQKPDVSLGPHLAYTFQWWVFAAFFPIAWVVRARAAVRDAAQETEDERAEVDDAPAAGEDASPSPAAASRTHIQDRYSGGRTRRRARTRDEEEEDDLIDREHP